MCASPCQAPNFSGALQLQAQATAIETATGSRAMVTQFLDIQVTAMADVPTPTLTPRDVSVSREAVNTSWESASTGSTGATVVYSSTFEGWRVLSAAFGRAAAFELWSAGDRMRNAAGTLVTVQPAAGNGAGWR